MEDIVLNSARLVSDDIKLMRNRYDEALRMQGIECMYQYPSLASSNTQGESVVDSYSDKMATYIFFDGAPKVKTFKRYGWVVENDKDLPFLIHCSFHLPHVQKDSLFRIGGQYTELPDRIFKVVEVTYDIQAPDHLVCQIVPVYDDNHNLVGRTKEEISQTYNKSNHFLKQPVDYRGHYRDNSKKGDEH